MEITRERSKSMPGPADRFTGIVWIDEIAVAPTPSRLRAFSVHFTPTARTAWHRHPFGQVIHLTEGSGLVQRHGGPVETVRAGDTVRFEPDELHWHGAGPSSFMTHIAMQEADDDRVDAYWDALVSDREYSS